MSPNSSSPLSPDDLRAVDRYVADNPLDEATVWVQTTDHEALEALYNPVTATLPGFRQPLSRGLISQVFATGLPLLERNVSQRKSHDPTVDSITGRPTRSLLAAPITAGGEVIGVVSAVRLMDTTHDRELNDEDLAKLGELARALGGLPGSQMSQEQPDD